MPARIQRKRTKGWKNPDNTIYVGRPTGFGNPFLPRINSRWGKYLTVIQFEQWLLANKRIIEHPRFGLVDKLIVSPRAWWILNHIKELKGKNLSCWCKEGDVCHADILLKLANEDKEDLDQEVEQCAKYIEMEEYDNE